MSDTETVEPADTGAGNRPNSHAAQRDRLVREAAQLAEAERAQAQMHSARNYREQMERDAEAAKKNETERQQKDADRAAAGDIADARSRYAQALGSTYDIRDPYRSLANAAMVEYGSFHRQQDALRKEAAAEQDPDKRRLIELRREIEGHDYMAITSERLAGISRAITMGDNDGARQRRRACENPCGLGEGEAAGTRRPATRIERAREGRTRHDRTRRAWQRRAARRSGTTQRETPPVREPRKRLPRPPVVTPRNEREAAAGRSETRKQEARRPQTRSAG